MAHPDRLESAGREDHAFGLWNPYDEAQVKKTGIVGELKVVPLRRRRLINLDGFPDLRFTYLLHSNGDVDMIVVDPATGENIPQTGRSKKIDGRIENDPQTGQHVLKYTVLPTEET